VRSPDVATTATAAADIQLQLTTRNSRFYTNDLGEFQ